MKKIVGLGNAIVDMMTKLPNESFLEKNNLQKGGMFLVDEETINKVLSETKEYEQIQTSGGSAANSIHGLSKLGSEVGYIGSVGEDAIGQFFIEDLKSAGIDTKFFYGKSLSGLAAALITPDSERTFTTYLGAAAELTPEQIEPKLFEGYDILHIEGYIVFNHDLFQKALEVAKSSGLQVSVDMASFNVVEANLDFFKEMTEKYVDIMFANEEEAKSFTGLEPKEACLALSEMVEISIVKVGKDGAYIKTKGQDMIHAPAFKAKSIDTTGAGDSYASGFLYGYINGTDFYNCSRIGALIAGKIIEHIGAKMPEEAWKTIRPQIQELLTKKQ